MITRLFTLLKHCWFDESDSKQLIAPAVLERLAQRVAASESRHTGEVCITVEASLPLSYMWRHCVHKTPIAELARQRATMQFGKLRVWDTENNNGVLIYLLMVERKIELLADRGVNRYVSEADWQGMVQRMAQAFASDRFEDGLTQALEEVSAVLVQNFPLQPDAANPNELPDDPLRI
ncbi:MAG: TPM domain-containing protein [Burkholderiaceae bacterium]